jgi:hypothetical protein
MKGVIPIKHIKKWNSQSELLEFCEHIVSHSERYEKERVFEAKEIINCEKGVKE